MLKVEGNIVIFQVKLSQQCNILMFQLRTPTKLGKGEEIMESSREKAGKDFMCLCTLSIKRPVWLYESVSNYS